MVDWTRLLHRFLDDLTTNPIINFYSPTFFYRSFPIAFYTKYLQIYDLTALAEFQSAHPGLTRFG